MLGIACCSDLSPPGGRASLTHSPPCPLKVEEGDSPAQSGTCPSPPSCRQESQGTDPSSLCPHYPNSCLQRIKPQLRATWGEPHAECALLLPALEEEFAVTLKTTESYSGPVGLDPDISLGVGGEWITWVRGRGCDFFFFNIAFPTKYEFVL